MAIRLENVNYVYSPDSAFKKQALKDVSLEIADGEFIGLIGHTGSGKSTLIQHLNGLMRATDGHIFYNNEDIYQEKYNMRNLRAKVGLVFQYPEHQLFEETVFKDVCFGPKNLGLDPKACEERARVSLNMVGLKEKHWQKSPFELSGGQKQRVAIAGVMAMKPQCIVLDEPTAMLDPNGRAEVIRTVRELNRKEGITAVLITHYMEEVIDADRVIVMDDGAIVMDGTPREVFSQVEKLKEYRLDVPQATELAYELKKAGVDLPDGILSQEEFVEAFLACCPGELLTEGQTGNADGDSCGSHSSCRDTESREEQTEAAGR